MELRAGTLWAACARGMREGFAQLYPLELRFSSMSICRQK